MSAMIDKRAAGRFYTRANPFNNPPFYEWAARAGLPGRKVLEPFAGANHLIHMLRRLSLCNSSASFDIVPGGDEVRRRDTLADFPKDFRVCVTNPPWLARNSATRRGLPYPATAYDDIYKHCLAMCLRHCDYVAALVPESFIRAGVFVSRLSAFVSLNSAMFSDTAHPVGLALFEPEARPTEIYSGENKMGTLGELQKRRPPPSPLAASVRFNAPDGNLGLLALDNTSGASIRFCEAEELANYPVSQTCRAITKIKVAGNPKIEHYNRFMENFRRATGDVFLTAYRGLRKDGQYRRRLDYALARDIINYVGVLPLSAGKGNS